MSRDTRATGSQDETIFAPVSGSYAGTDFHRSSSGGRRRCCGRTDRRSRCRNDHWGCGYSPPLLWSAASVCGAGAILLLDARTAGVGPIPRRVDVPGCQGVQVGFIARTASPCTIPELPPHRRKSRRHRARGKARNPVTVQKRKYPACVALWQRS